MKDYLQFLNWYDLNTPFGLYNFMEELKNDPSVNLNDYYEIKIYYDCLCNNAFKEEPNMITVEYVIKKLRAALIRYGFAHTSKEVKWKYHYYWHQQ